MRRHLFTILILFSAIKLSAQNPTTITVHMESTGKEEVIDIPEGMQTAMSLDSLYWNWQDKNLLSLGENCQMGSVNPNVSDSIYIDRLSRIPTIIEMPYNEAVRKFIDMYATRLRNNVAYMLAAGNFYIPIFEEALDLYDLPIELKYLPVIESSFNPKAVSRQGATGLWQFMYGTGKIYGLQSNSLVDDRRDPVKSTWAAVRYLKDLYDIYKDWNLVLAAYNCGPGRINKAIRRAGGATDFWKIYDYLPRETRGYVPAFIAANYIMTYYCEHNICPLETKLPPATDTIYINKNLHLKQIAEVCNLDIEQLRGLNPQYKKDVIPGNTELSCVRLPQTHISTFIDRQDSIFAYKKEQYLSKRAIVKLKNLESSNGRLYHRIRSGENLGSIARKYGVSVKTLRRLNNIQGNNIRAGRKLRIR